MHLDFEHPATERTPRVVSAVKLHRAAGRRKAGLFLVEGKNCVEAAVARGVVSDIFVTESAATKFAGVINTAARAGVFVHAVTDKAGRQLSDTVTSTGLFAVCRPVVAPTTEDLPDSITLLSVAVGTNEPGNAGTLIRVSDALGADAIVFAGESVDPHGGKAARASAGSLFHIPVARHQDPLAFVRELQGRGVTVIATTAAGELSLDDAAPVLARPTAWLFGNEAHGLPEELVAAADYRVNIPIRGRAESLNLATAASICLYESARALHNA